MCNQVCIVGLLGIVAVVAVVLARVSYWRRGNVRRGPRPETGITQRLWEAGRIG
jgi:uncharacterized iron-regulated membrane protein